MATIASANDAICDGMRRQRRRERDRREVLRPIRVVDALLSELEELHLAGRKRVPETFDDHLATLNAAIPEGLRRDLRSRITITHLMDQLFEIQDLLLDRKVTGRTDLEDDGPEAPAGLLSRAS